MLGVARAAVLELLVAVAQLVAVAEDKERGHQQHQEGDHQADTCKQYGRMAVSEPGGCSARAPGQGLGKLVVSELKGGVCVSIRVRVCMCISSTGCECIECRKCGAVQAVAAATH